MSETTGSVEPHMVQPTGDREILQLMQADPTVYPLCMFDGEAAAMIFVAPEGSYSFRDSEIIPLCVQHCDRERSMEFPIIPLLDLTDGWCTKRLRYETPAFS